ncbi:hypothetical protein [Streptomyces sp. B21-083]|uniref:hypothetical protein n=1 Tax=Streptomyces sp. B21-083 TaxID=3039410 RepID=UPI002FEE6DBF
MPLFRRPGDHRDEFVAGALVGAVVIVLGYASGIGATTASGAAEAAAPPPAPPVATAPPAAAPGDSGMQAPGGDTGGGTSGGWTGQVPAGTGELPVYGGDTGTGSGSGAGAGTPGHTGHAGPGTSPTPTPTPPSGTSPAPAPSPTPSGSEPPTDDGSCADGEVRLVAPLLTGITQPLFGLLGGTDATGTDVDETPDPTAAPCIGLAPLSGLLGGSVPSVSPSASPLPEVTP